MLTSPSPDRPFASSRLTNDSRLGRGLAAVSRHRPETTRGALNRSLQIILVPPNIPGTHNARQLAYTVRDDKIVRCQTDNAIPAECQRWMYRRANARKIVEVPTSSHVAMLGHPKIVADLIEERLTGPST
jgi:pimeloyl-ACP methyl ester carboxylesterase